MRPSRLFKCLSDETRLRCVTLLQKEGRLCVCELTVALDLSQPKISRHLASLRQCNVVVDIREGQWVYYQINPELPEWAYSILNDVLAAVEKSEQLDMDLLRLRKMSDRPVTTTESC
jgi:ArsR family transcriptional regulator